MTIPNTTRKAGPLLGTGSQTAWPFTFKVFSAGDLKVTTAVTSTGVETTLVLNTDYSVSLNSDQEATPGGTVTHPISGAALAVGRTLTIVGDVDYDQTLDLPSGGDFSPVALENGLDRHVMQTQQLKEEVDRALKFPVSDAVLNATLPSKAVRAGNVLAFDADGEPVAGPDADTLALTATLIDNIADVVTVADNIAAVIDVADNIDGINVLADNITDVTTVINNLVPIHVVAEDISTVNLVAAAIDSVITVADNIADVTTVADAINGGGLPSANASAEVIEDFSAGYAIYDTDRAFPANPFTFEFDSSIGMRCLKKNERSTGSPLTFIRRTIVGDVFKANFTNFVVKEFSISFKVESLDSDDGCFVILETATTNSLVFIVNRESTFDATRRCFLLVKSAATGATISTPIGTTAPVIGTWYRLVVDVSAEGTLRADIREVHNPLQVLGPRVTVSGVDRSPVRFIRFQDEPTIGSGTVLWNSLRLRGELGDEF